MTQENQNAQETPTAKALPSASGYVPVGYDVGYAETLHSFGDCWINGYDRWNPYHIEQSEWLYKRASSDETEPKAHNIEPRQP